MKVKSVDFYFSPGLRYVTSFVCLGVCIYLLAWTAYGIWSILFVLIGLLVLSTKYEFIVNTNEHIIADSFKLLWLPTTSKIYQYQQLNNILTFRERNVYTTNSRARTGHADYHEYVASLKFDNDKSVEFLRKIDPHTFTKEVQRISDLLKIPIERS